MVKVFLNGRMVKDMKENSKIMRCMVKVKCNGKMAGFKLYIISMISRNHIIKRFLVGIHTRNMKCLKD